MGHECSKQPNDSYLGRYQRILNEKFQVQMENLNSRNKDEENFFFFFFLGRKEKRKRMPTQSLSLTLSRPLKEYIGATKPHVVSVLQGQGSPVGD